MELNLFFQKIGLNEYSDLYTHRLVELGYDDLISLDEDISNEELRNVVDSEDHFEKILNVLGRTKKNNTENDIAIDTTAIRKQNKCQVKIPEITLGDVFISPWIKDSSPTSSVQDIDLVYKKLCILGSSNSNVVYKAIHKESLKIVALKCIFIRDELKRNEALSEFKVMCSLCKQNLASNNHNGNNHNDNLSQTFGAIKKYAYSPYIVKFYNAYPDFTNYSVCLAIEYMNGGSLQDVLDNEIHIEIDDIIKIAYSITNALFHLHSRNITHRDIKPSNILFNSEGYVKLSDFGIVREYCQIESCETFTGTISYMAPERIRLESYSFPSDIWSLGMTLIALFLGFLPQYQEIERKPINEDVLLTEYKMPYDLADFILSCLENDPATRASAAYLRNHKIFKDMTMFNPLDCLISNYWQNMAAMGEDEIKIVLKVIRDRLFHGKNLTNSDTHKIAYALRNKIYHLATNIAIDPDLLIHLLIEGRNYEKDDSYSSSFSKREEFEKEFEKKFLVCNLSQSGSESDSNSDS